MSLRPNFMLLGESVEKETTFLQRPPEAADDDGEQMEAEDGDGIFFSNLKIYFFTENLSSSNLISFINLF